MQTMLLVTMLVAGAAVVAGCTSPTNNPAPATSTPQATGGGGNALRDEINAAFTATPITTTGDKSKHNTPAHVFLQTEPGKYQFVHWDQDDPAQATQALFVGDVVSGNFCVGAGGVTKAQYDAGYVHFHDAVAPNWDAGHNNGGVYDASVKGYWFRHIAAMTGNMQMMGMTLNLEKAKVFPLMPADFNKIQPCAGGASSSGNANQLRDEINAAYTATPISTTKDVSAHNTPQHVFLQVDATHYYFVHYDTNDPTQATQALFVGDMFAGKFCLGAGGVTKEQYDAGYVHFHDAVAPNWDAGHNNGGVYDPSAQGYWFRHVAAMTGSMTMMGMQMNIEKGKVFPLMPADFSKIQPCA